MSVNQLEAAVARIMVDLDSSLYKEIEQDPHVLNNIDSVPFFNTPLHVAASFTLLHGAASIHLPEHIQFVTEIMRLKPSFALKLNCQGFTPIHLALQNHYDEMALHLVHLNKDLVRVKMRGGLTSLHLATQYGNIHLVTEFYKACPDSIRDITIKGETVLHFAVIYKQFNVFEFLVKSILKKGPLVTRTILNKKDKDGNTILHIAALNRTKEVIELLKKGPNYMMDFDAKNSTGKTASDIAAGADIKTILEKARVYKITRIVMLILWRRTPQITEEKRNVYLVVATLVATATYQAALSPPGGLHQSDLPGTNNTVTHLPSNSSLTEGKSVMSDLNFGWYSTMNTYAFLVSTFNMMSVLPQNAVSGPLYLSIILLTGSFYFATTVISPDHYTTQTFNLIFWFFSSTLIVLGIYYRSI